MTGWIQKICNRPASRMVFVLVLSAVFIGSGFLFLTNEMVQNKTYYLRHVEQDQQILSDQYGQQVEELLQSGKSIADVVKIFEKKPVNATYRWCFLASTTELFQAKDSNYRNKLLDEKVNNFSKLMVWLDSKNQIVSYTSLSVDGSEYVVGIVSDKDNVVLESKTDKHTTYVMMAAALLSLVLFSAIVLLTSIMNRKDKEAARVRKEVQSLNRKLEELASEVVVEEEAGAEYAATGTNYVAEHEEDLLFALLRKTTNSKLFPLSIAVVRAQGSIENRQFAITSWNKERGKNHIILHTDSEMYAVLLYRTSESDAMEILHQLRECLEKSDVHVSIVFRHMSAPDTDQELIELYDKMKERLREEC